MERWATQQHVHHLQGQNLRSAWVDDLERVAIAGKETRAWFSGSVHPRRVNTKRMHFFVLRDVHHYHHEVQSSTHDSKELYYVEYPFVHP